MALPESIGKEYRELAVEYTAALVRMDTANPPGGELRAAQFIAEELEKAGFAVEVDDLGGGRGNVLATLGNPDDIGLLFNGHLDVVPAEGEWQHPPFAAEIVGDKLYGRGSCDMKSGVAAMMAAGIAAARAEVSLGRGLQLAFVADEETSSIGVQALLARHDIRAAAAVVGEPSGLQVHLGNKGYVSFTLRTQGKSCHGSDPSKGENAIYKMARIVCRLEEYAEELQHKTDPYLGKAAFSVGIIRGGNKVNTVPDVCTCDVEQRLLIGDTAQQVRQKLWELAPELAAVDMCTTFNASLIEGEHPLVKAAQRAAEAELGRAETGIFYAGTEAAFFSERGIPTIVLGPGDLAQAHTVDEFVDVQQIRQAAGIYYRLIREYTA